MAGAVYVIKNEEELLLADDHPDIEHAPSVYEELLTPCRALFELITSPIRFLLSLGACLWCEYKLPLLAAIVALYAFSYTTPAMMARRLDTSAWQPQTRETAAGLFILK